MRQHRKEYFDRFIDFFGWPFDRIMELRNRVFRSLLFGVLLITYGLVIVYPCLVVIGIPLACIDVIRDEFGSLSVDPFKYEVGEVVSDIYTDKYAPPAVEIIRRWRIDGRNMYQVRRVGFKGVGWPASEESLV